MYRNSEAKRRAAEYWYKSTQPDLSDLEAERQRVAEACAKVCENDESGRDSGGYFADTIRAGQWREHL